MRQTSSFRGIVITLILLLLAAGVVFANWGSGLSFLGLIANEPIHDATGAFAAMVGPCTENFDTVTAPALPAGWSTNFSGVPPAPWVTSTTSPDTAPNDAFATDPAAATNNELISPVYSIPVVGGSFSFRNSYDTQNGSDGMVLEIRIGAGAYQDIITAGGSFSAGGYNGSIGPANPHIGGRMAWTGNSAGYITTTVILPPAASGQNIQLKWRMATDSSVSGNGVRIDTITGLPCGSTPTPTATNTPVDFVGLTSTGTLVTFNSNSPGTTTSPVTVTGLIAGDTLIGIDLRPVDTQLIGLGYNSSNGDVHVYAINPLTGAATSINPNPLNIGSALSRVTMDFDPTANVIRVVTSQSFFANNARILTGGTGAFAGDTALTNSGIRATAYSRNNAGGGTSGATTLYAIDGPNNRLVTQGSVDYFTGNGTSPNSGSITTVATLTGVTGSTVVGFDIYNAAGTAAASPGTAFVANTTTLFTLNLSTAAATSVGTIGSGLVMRDIATGVPAGLFTPTATNTPTNTGTPTNTATITATSTPTNTPTPTPTICGTPGALDGSWGFPVVTAVGTAIDVAYSVAIQSDGKIVAVGQGFSTSSVNYDFAVVRYNSDGVLDSSFGGTGKVLTPIGTGDEYARSVAIQTDGRIVAAGYIINGSNVDFAIVRYNTDGSLDTSFNGSGKAVTSIGSGNEFAYSVAIQADGRIVVAGPSSNGSNDDFALVRYNTNGTLDTSFNGTGKVVTSIGSSDDVVRSVAIQADGRIVAAGSSGGFPSDDFAVVRYNTNGSLDTTFNGTGKVLTPIGSSSDAAQSVAVQSDGKIVAGGSSYNGSNNDFALVRYTTSGGLDTTFNGTGKVVTAIGNEEDAGLSLAIQSDGKLVMAGQSHFGARDDFSLARYNTNGSPDTTFNGTGTVHTEVRSFSDGALSVAIQNDGRIVAAGRSLNGTDDDFALVRYNTDGDLHSAFGTGMVVTPIGSSVDQINSVALQPDGKIVAAGSSNNGSNLDFALVRYKSNGTLDTTFNVTGKVVTSIGSGSDVGNSVAIQSDGKIVLAGSTTSGSDDFALARYNSNGSLDTTFNGIGIVITPIGGSVDSCYSVAIQADGKIVAVGKTYNSESEEFDGVVVRYNSNGSLDTTFNGTGMVFVSFGFIVEFNSVAIQSDGKILAAGAHITSRPIGEEGDHHFVLYRFNANGDVDTTFHPSGNGYVVAEFGSPVDARARSVAIQNDGRIVLAGEADDGVNSDFALARFNPNGTFDFTFNGTGKVVTPVGSSDDFARSVGIQADSRIVAAGSTNNGSDFGLVRYNQDGTLDTAFNGTGKIITSIFGSGTETANSVAVQPNGRILAAGVSNNDFALVAYYQNTCPVGPTPTATATNTPTATVTNTPTATATGTPSASISGTIIYGNAIGIPAPPRFVKNVSVASTAGSPAVGPVITGTPGTYTLTGFGAGSYTIKPTKAGGANTAISSNDAARIAQGVSGSSPFVSLNQKFAADVSGNGTVSSQDAAKIAQFVAGVNPLPLPNLSGQWRFFTADLPGPPTAPLPTPPYNDSRTYASVSGSLTGENYIALLLGEVSGNWNPATHPRPVVGGQMSNVGEDGRAVEKPITVTVQTAAAAADKEIVIPVSVEGVTGKDVISYEFDLRYDPSVIQPMENPVDITGTVSRGLMVVTNPYEPGLLRVVVYGPLPIDKDGVLLNLRFTAVGTAGSSSPLTFERIIFNEGERALILSDGRVELF